MREQIAVIIPAYNEELTIKQVILDFHNQLPHSAIYVIDNNSTDKTNEIAVKTLLTNEIEGKVLFVKEKGKANAIRHAHTNIMADIYVMVDADCTYLAEDIHKLLKPVLTDKADMVVGDRLTSGDYQKENKRSFHNFGNTLVISLINKLFDSSLNDVMSGYRVFNKKFIKNYPVLCKGFELETDLTIHALHYRMRVMELPTKYKDRPDGSESKLNTFTDGFKVLKTIFWIFKDYKPLYFFLSFSCFFAMLGLITGSLPIIDFITTKYVEHVPLAILATGLMLFSLILLSIGIILDTIVKHHKVHYEIQLMNYKG